MVFLKRNVGSHLEMSSVNPICGVILLLAQHVFRIHSLERFSKYSLKDHRELQATQTLLPGHSSFSSRLSFLPFLFLALSVSGCNSIFLQPHKPIYPFVIMDQLKLDEVEFQSEDGTLLTGWYFSTLQNCANEKYQPSCIPKIKKPKGLVVQFHGNGENMSTHYRAMSWVLLQGYDLFVFDYRSYGESGGSKSLRGAVEDSTAAVQWSVEKARSQNLPLILFGQSLGGTLLLRSLSHNPPNTPIAAVVIEGSFSTYQGIAREKLAMFWISWPLQWLAYIFISDRWSPLTPKINNIAPTPVLVLHSREDRIVPFHHGERLFKALPQPKQFWPIEEPGHINSWVAEGGAVRKKLAGFFDHATQRPPTRK
jgi:fermentation-respiration switch protein FrsA (DUF1100 family)